MPTPTDDQRPDNPAPSPAGERAGERIAKLLARAGIASRREVERMIVEGRIALNGVAIDTPATVLRSLHGVTVDGRPVAQPAPARLFLHHKPAGLLVTERDPAGRPTIYDRLPADLPRVVPVGRLDLATEGLLLLTTDGGLKRELELPATGVERAYRARAYGDVTQAQLEALIEGVEIDGIRYGPIDANLERRTGANVWIELILTEGKNREVRRVLEYLGLQVGRLIRTRYGPFVLGDLPAGAVGEVRQADLVAFRRTLTGRGGGNRPAADERIAVLPHEAPAPEPTPEPARAAPPPRPNRPPRAQSSRKSGWGTQARPSRPKPAADRPAREDAAPRKDRQLRADDRPRTEPRATPTPYRRDGKRPSPARPDRQPGRSDRPDTRDVQPRRPREGGGSSPNRARRAPGDGEARDRNTTHHAGQGGPSRDRTAARPRGPRPDRPDGTSRRPGPGSAPRKPSGRPPRGKR